MCYTFLAKEPICSYCSFPDFEMDDSEPMPEVHAIFADKIQIPEPYLSLNKAPSTSSSKQQRAQTFHEQR